jgi:glutaredoxin-related protein/predicted GNAT family acetyltransferase
MIDNRYEADKSRAAAYDGEKLIGECDAVKTKSFWIITHTKVDKAYGGQGIAADLVKCMVDAAVKAGVRIKPFCSYAARLFEKNEAYQTAEDHSVITVYGMKTCPDCVFAEAQMENNSCFRFVDIGEHVRNLKAFLKVRDNSPVFDEAKKNGYAGIPCFVMEDGTVTLSPEDVGLMSRPEEGQACRADGSGC